MFPPNTIFLVVDDMEPLRRSLRSMLRELGYHQVFEAPSAVHAVQMLQKGAGIGHGIDVILSDWQMPGMTGLEFLQHVRQTEAYAKIPFIMITAESERQQIVSAIQAGVSSYLLKPISRGQVEDKLKAVWTKMKSTGSVAASAGHTAPTPAPATAAAAPEPSPASPSEPPAEER